MGDMFGCVEDVRTEVADRDMFGRVEEVQTDYIDSMPPVDCFVNGGPGMFGSEEIQQDVRTDMFGDREVVTEVVDQDMFGCVEDVRTQVADRDMFGRVEEVQTDYIDSMPPVDCFVNGGPGM